MILDPKLAYQLDPTGDGQFLVARGDATVMHVGKDGAITWVPDGTVADRSMTCALSGPFLVYQPVDGGTFFYFLPGE